MENIYIAQYSVGMPIMESSEHSPFHVLLGNRRMHMDLHRRDKSTCLLSSSAGAEGSGADLVVSDDLADEVAGVGEVSHDGHPHAQHQDVGVLLQQALHHRLAHACTCFSQLHARWCMAQAAHQIQKYAAWHMMTCQLVHGPSSTWHIKISRCCLAHAYTCFST